MAYKFRIWQDDACVSEHDDATKAARERDRLREECSRTGCGNGDPSSNEGDGIECGPYNSEPHAVGVQIIDTETGLDVTGHTYDVAVMEALS